MRIGMVFVVVVGLLLSAGPIVAEQYLFDYYGFSWEESNLLQEVGFIDQIMPPLTADLVNYQYTFAWVDLNIDSAIPMGPYWRYTYVGGSFRVYEDASFNAWYDDSNCPSLTLISDPSTFTDSELYLEAVVDTIIHMYNSMTKIGSFSGTISYVGGTHLGEIPLGFRDGTVFGGTTANPLGCIPVGCDYRWDGQAFSLEQPVGAEHNSWGAVKSLYR
ncbi:MAG: hypothetical protein KAW17_01905 [Candidatus Eisenbacteria sp.]|nr:hypothetical protein [Candidatus Eisenbacteria bacterium]